MVMGYLSNRRNKTNDDTEDYYKIQRQSKDHSDCAD